MHSNSNPNYGNPEGPLPASDALDELQELIADYLVCSDDQRTVLALWVLHTYSYEAAFITPCLDISSPVEESGKSTCLGVLRGLCAQPWWASGIPASTLTRKIIAERPTVLLDDWHTTFRGRDGQQITGFLVNSCDLFQPYSLLKGSAQKGFSTCEVAIYCPKAFAGLGPLPPALARHSIPLVLQRAKPGERTKPAFALLKKGTTAPFTSWMRRWTKDNLDAITRNSLQYHYRHRLSGLSPHQQSCSNVLIALAQAIGGRWPQKAQAALLAIFRGQQDSQASPLQLLSDVRAAFAHHRGPQRIFTAQLLDYLHSLDHRTWNEWNNRGEPLTAHALSRWLRKSFKVYSRSQRWGGKKGRGYRQSDFAEAWARYLPAPDTQGAAQEALGNAAEGVHGSVAEDVHGNSGRGAHRITASDATVPGQNRRQISKIDFRPVPARPGSPHQAPALRRAQVASTEAPAEVITRSSDDAHLPSALRPGKSGLVSMSRFQAGFEKIWTKSSSLLKQFAGKATGLFTTVRS